MPTVRVNLSDEVMSVLEGISNGLPEGADSVGDAISHLALSYDASMEDAGGKEAQPVHMPAPEGGQPLQAATHRADNLPGVGDIEKFFANNSQPVVAKGGEIMTGHSMDTPLDGDGLVKWDYILAAQPPILDILNENGIGPEELSRREIAIRQVLTEVPEDVWNGPSVTTILEKKLKGGQQ